MLEAIIWGLVQGLTEFLPVSSSGHLVLIPALLGIEGPDLATSAVLHLGTLAAVIAYYRKDLRRLLAFGSDAAARRTLLLLAIATAPGVVGFLVSDVVERLQSSTTAVSLALVATGVILLLSGFLTDEAGTLEQARPVDALMVGAAQILAFIPGISRSGTTIAAGMSRGLSRVEAARLSFLMAIPAIAGAGLFEGIQLAGTGGLGWEALVGVVVAALAGYAAIAVLLRTLTRFGMRPYAFYAVGAGIVGLVLL